MVTAAVTTMAMFALPQDGRRGTTGARKFPGDAASTRTNSEPATASGLGSRAVTVGPAAPPDSGQVSGPPATSSDVVCLPAGAPRRFDLAWRARCHSGCSVVGSHSPRWHSVSTTGHGGSACPEIYLESAESLVKVICSSSRRLLPELRYTLRSSLASSAVASSPATDVGESSAVVTISLNLPFHPAGLLRRTALAVPQTALAVPQTARAVPIRDTETVTLVEVIGLRCPYAAPPERLPLASKDRAKQDRCDLHVLRTRCTCVDGRPRAATVSRSRGSALRPAGTAFRGIGRGHSRSSKRTFAGVGR